MTGIPWRNYWPREFVQGFMYDMRRIGQQFQVLSNEHQTVLCPHDVVTEQLNTQFEQQEAQWKQTRASMTEQDKLHEWEEKRRTTLTPGAPDYMHKADVIPRSFVDDVVSDQYVVIRHNGTNFCRPKGI